MGLMMWFMARGMRGGQQEQHAQEGSLADLKAEQARLAEKIATLEEDKIATLEEERAARASESDEDADECAPAQVR
jgi:septal ring factor EnvC (AmiA/AmiB activator)